jgi:hypothetical protein
VTDARLVMGRLAGKYNFFDFFWLGIWIDAIYMILSCVLISEI